MRRYDSRKVYLNASKKAKDNQRYTTPSMAILTMFGDNVEENNLGKDLRLKSVPTHNLISNQTGIVIPVNQSRGGE